MLALINLERGNADVTETAFTTLQTLIEKMTPSTAHDQWPETLVAYRGVLRFGKNSAVRDLLNVLYSRRTMRSIPAGNNVWHAHIVALYERSQHVVSGRSHQSFDTDLDSKDWIPATRVTARSRGNGSPSAIWHRNEQNEIHHVSGHQSDYLLYRIPLRGSFEVQADIGALGTTQILLGGNILGSVGGGRVALGSFREGAGHDVIDPPLAEFEPWSRIRAVFRPNSCRFYLNGRLIREVPLPKHHDPWIGIRSWWKGRAMVRDFRITGQPKIPHAMLMSASQDLTGWLAYHETASWRYEPDAESTGQIVGAHWLTDQGTHRESLLRYIRPLTDGSSVEYDFLYQPGVAHTHPALDRLAFLLRPNGVRLHWVPQ